MTGGKLAKPDIAPGSDKLGASNKGRLNMSYGYSSPGPDISAWATEFDQAQDAWLEQQKAAEEAAAAKYAAAVESAKIGDGFCALAAEQPLPFAGCWLPIFQTWQERLAQLEGGAE